MVVQVKAYRPPSRSVVPYEDWKEEASCLTSPVELFELGDHDVIPQADQEDLIAQGLKVCATCPVMQSCRANSNELDRYWTTRGGQPPEGLFPDSKRPKADQPKNGTPGGGAKPGGTRQKTCRKGHRAWKARADGKSRFCTICRKEKDALRDRSKRPSRNRHPKGGTL